MPLSPDEKTLRLESTKAAAEAFYEDVQHLRALIEKTNQSRGELRRASAILRRLLVDTDLATIAAPRIGRVLLDAPDNDPVYGALDAENADLFASGGAHLFGFAIRGIMSADADILLEGFDPERVIQLPIDSFLKQQVLFWQGRWVNRAAIIKYVANVASGVHSGAPKTDDERLLSEARNRAHIGRRPNGSIGISILAPEFTFDDSKFDFSEAAIDLTLIEMFSAARYLTQSASVDELLRTIRT